MTKLKHYSPIKYTDNAYYINKFSKYSKELSNNITGVLQDLSYEQMNDLLSFFEQGAINLRQEMDKKVSSDIEHGLQFNREIWNIIEQFNGYEVRYDGTGLIVKAPIILNRLSEKPKQSSFNIADNIANAIHFYAEKNNLNLNNLIPGHKCIAVIRKTKKFNRNNIVDNDNLELSRIINTITGVMGFSDSAKNLDLISCYRECDDTPTSTFLLCPLDKIHNYSEVFQK